MSSNQRLWNSKQFTPARLVYIGLFVGFLAGLWMVISPFLRPFIWSVIIVTALWPIYTRLATYLAPRKSLPALLMTTMIAVCAVIAVVPVSWQLTNELRLVSGRIQGSDPAPYIEMVKSIPWVGSRLVVAIEEIIREEGGSRLVFEHQSEAIDLFTLAAKGIVNTLFTVIIAVASCYFLFRHGPELSHQLMNLLTRVGGPNIHDLVETTCLTVRGAAYSVIFTAVAQGVLAGIGFLATGAPVPILLGLATMVFSLVPFGTPVIYLPVAAYMALTYPEWYWGAGLALWGICVVSAADNVLRPMFISQTTRSSIVLVFVGVIGGVVSFGLLGVFIGPAIMAVAQQLWRDYSTPVTLENI